MRPSRKILKYHYVTKHKTLEEIGNIYGVSKQCVLKWIDYYGLPRRKTSRNKSIISKSQFKKYIDAGYSIHKISTIINVDQGTLWGLLSDYGLKNYYIRTPFKDRKLNITKKELQQIYDNHSVKDTMKLINCNSNSYIYEILDRYGIKRKRGTYK